MNLTGKQKAKLKRLANARAVMFQVGQNGLTDNVIDNIFDNLRKYEVGRISVLKSSPNSLEEIMDQLTDLGFYVISKIGRVILLYRENKNLKDRILL